jgi:hypothetical protein
MLVWVNWLFQAHQQSLRMKTLGFVSFTGRIHTQIKDGGKWISPVLKQDFAEISEMLRHVYLFTMVKPISGSCHAIREFAHSSYNKNELLHLHKEIQRWLLNN